MDTPERKYEEYWKTGGQTLGPYVYFRQNILQDVVGSGKRVLDVGCGDGLTSSILIPENEVYGVDVSEAALARAQERGIKITKFNLDQGLPDIKTSFDVILLLDILEHVHDPERLLDAAVSQMSEDTILVVSVPNTMNLLTRFFFLLGHYVDVMDRSHKESKLFSEHLHVFSKAKLEAFFESRKLLISSKHFYFPSKFNEERFKKFQFLGDMIYSTRVHQSLPSLLSLGFVYSCKLK